MAIGLVGLGHRGGGVVTATRAFSSILSTAGPGLAGFAIAPVAMTDELHHHQPAAPHAPAALRSSTWPAAAALSAAAPRHTIMSCLIIV